MEKCRYCSRIRDEWDCHGQACRENIAKALRRQRAGLPMTPNVIRSEIPPGATTEQVIEVLYRQRLRARRSNEDRRARRKEAELDLDRD
jgi:hypothetical protein